MQEKILVMGASNEVGYELLTALAERGVPSSRVIPLVGEELRGKLLGYGLEEDLKGRNVEDYEFQPEDIVLMGWTRAEAGQYLTKALESGCHVVGYDPLLKQDKRWHLTLPKINGAELGRHPAVVPNPLVSELLTVLSPLHLDTAIQRLGVATYQSVSGAGREAMDELYGQTRKIFEGGTLKPAIFKKPIAFNVIPQTTDFLANGYSIDEMDLIMETQKILHIQLPMEVTCVRVPMFLGYGMAVNIEFSQEVDLDRIYDLLEENEDVLVMDRPLEDVYATPMDCRCDDLVYVSRLRHSLTNPRSISLWLVADNLRQGIAASMLGVAELWIEFPPRLVRDLAQEELEEVMAEEERETWDIIGGTTEEHHDERRRSGKHECCSCQGCKTTKVAKKPKA